MTTTRPHRHPPPAGAAGILAPFLLLLGSGPAPGGTATTITVNTTSDVADFGGSQRIADLPGPDGLVSLREAAAAATNTPGPEAIGFDIPTTDPGFSGGVFGITTQGQISLGDDGTTLDGTTQPGGHPIHLVGNVPASWQSPGLVLAADRNIVRGLHGFRELRHAFELRGHDNRVEGCTIRYTIQSGIVITGSGNRVGGTDPETGCDVRFCGGWGVEVRGIGSSGTTILGSVIEYNESGIGVAGTSTTIGGTLPGAGNVIGGNGYVTAQGVPAGAQVSLAGSAHVVEGNHIGVDGTGLVKTVGSANSGILVSGSHHRIGGSEAGAGNVIAGQDAWSFRLDARPAGVRIVGATSVLLQGNLIGTDATGIAPIRNQIGIRIEGATSDIVIGGPGAGEANRVAFSLMDGIAVQGTLPDRIRISGNSVYANDLLGIDLGDDPVGGSSAEGATSNDAGDGDAGANGLQNHPLIESATDDGTRTLVRGSVDTPAPQGVVIDFFASDSPDASGFGEGQRFLGQGRPDASGHFTAILPGGNAGSQMTATATDVLGNSSEFSPAVEIEAATVAVDPPPARLDFSLDVAPNPAAGRTTIQLSLPLPSVVDLRVFDALGREVFEVDAGSARPAGRHTWIWDGRDRNGRSVAGGLYFVRAQAGPRQVARRLVIGC